MRRLADAGIISIWPAGNDGIDVDAAAAGSSTSYPSSLRAPLKLTVASSNQADELINSNFGRRTVDLAAPGDVLLQSYP
jgi:hypothetical protein